MRSSYRSELMTIVLTDSFPAVNIVQRSMQGCSIILAITGFVFAIDAAASDYEQEGEQ